MKKQNFIFGMLMLLALMLTSCATYMQKVTSNGAALKQEKITKPYIFINQNTAFDIAEMSERRISKILTKDGVPFEIYSRKKRDLNDLASITKKFEASDASHLIEITMTRIESTPVGKAGQLIDFTYLIQVRNRQGEKIWEGGFDVDNLDVINNGTYQGYQEVFNKMRADGVL